MANAAEKQADLTYSLFKVTIVESIALVLTLLFVGWAALAASRSAKTAHDEHMATHRPRVKVRFIQNAIHGPSDQPPEAWITFANVGTTNATITEFGSDIALRRDGIWIKGLSSSANPLEIPITLASGKAETFDVVGQVGLEDQDWYDILGDKIELVMVGEIAYSNGSGAEWHTSFYRVFHQPSNRFERPENAPEEFEFQD